MLSKKGYTNVSRGTRDIKNGGDSNDDGKGVPFPPLSVSSTLKGLSVPRLTSISEWPRDPGTSRVRRGSGGGSNLWSQSPTV